jgi:pimeloyl-ACP methyl ester carboxylesterase
VLSEEIFGAETDDGARLALSELVLPGRPAREGAPAVLLIHGLAQNRGAFIAGALPSELIGLGARVMVGELRGHGRNRGAAAPGHRLEHYLRHDLPALIAASRARAGTERVHLFGHSLGGLLGYALLASDAARQLASLVAFGAPVGFRQLRPIVRLLATLAHPVIDGAGLPAVRLDWALFLFAQIGLRPKARGPARWIQDLAKLANPDAADPAQLRALLAAAEPEPSALFLELTEGARRRLDTLAGVDLVRAVRRSSLPIAAVVGGRDLFAPPVSVRPLAHGAGPRRILELPDAAHVDIAMGDRASWVAQELWRFLALGEAPRARSP